MNNLIERNYIEMLSEVFYSLVITTGVGFLMALAKLCFKSRCKEVNLFCFKCIRDPESEQRELEFEMTHQNNNNSSKDNL